MDYIPIDYSPSLELFVLSGFGALLLALGLFLVYGPLRDRLETDGPRRRLTEWGFLALISAPLGMLIFLLSGILGFFLPREAQLRGLSSEIQRVYDLEFERSVLQGLDYPLTDPSGTPDRAYGFGKFDLLHEDGSYTPVAIQLLWRDGELIILDHEGEPLTKRPGI